LKFYDTHISLEEYYLHLLNYFYFIFIRIFIANIIIIIDFLPDIAAFPESVNIIEGISNDIRTPHKLIDGVNNTKDGRHSWLAPILPGEVSKNQLCKI